MEVIYCIRLVELEHRQRRSSTATPALVTTIVFFVVGLLLIDIAFSTICIAESKAKRNNIQISQPVMACITDLAFKYTVHDVHVTTTVVRKDKKGNQDSRDEVSTSECQQAVAEAIEWGSKSRREQINALAAAGSSVW
ncbi:hypothetical protein Vadar_027376 [Vaccinium darrowii]|uniref:Uncharacterized protein n=1 Tax=Vaccinium darrowii TaxID=229202 RepID=A0ACB7XCT3_9ERIC|nr:hypothetical protein Vadar_027376 [Vaccinium darrowii]